MYAAIDAHILPEDDTWELIEGKIINKMPKYPPHVRAYQKVLLWLGAVFGAAYVSGQNPLALDDNNEPEPDVFVLKEEVVAYYSTPTADDARLVVEVSHSSLHYDITTKAEIYARAGISDSWVIDIPNRRVLVHRSHSKTGYTVTAYDESETVAPLASPESGILVSELLP